MAGSALDQLGLGDAARARATTLQAITVRDMRSAATLASLDLSASPYASLSRADLASLLRAEISALSGMTDIAANITHVVQRGPDQGKAVHMLTDDKVAAYCRCVDRRRWRFWFWPPLCQWHG